MKCLQALFKGSGGKKKTQTNTTHPLFLRLQNTSTERAPGPNANPRTLSAEKSATTDLCSSPSDAPPLPGPLAESGFASSPGPAPTAGPRPPRAAAHRQLPTRKIKIILTQAEPQINGEKQGKRAARLDQSSYGIDTQWLPATKLENAFKKCCTYLAEVVQAASV